MALVWAGTVSSVLCTDIVGTVLDADGNRVKGIKIAALRPTGQAAGEAVTNAVGNYRITHLEPSTHDFTLDSAGTPFHPGTAVAFVGKEGLTINWRVSQTSDASAIAAPGITGGPVGGQLKAPDAIGLIVDGVAGVGVLSGYAAGGGFGSHRSPPPSPSM